MKMTGSCMCGQVRYETTGNPFAVNHCHCESCRKHNGAPVATLAGFKIDQVHFSGSDRKTYESSPGAFRAFCENCGTPLTWEGDGDDLGQIVEFHISTFDDPEALVPTSHAFEPRGDMRWLKTYLLASSLSIPSISSANDLRSWKRSLSQVSRNACWFACPRIEFFDASHCSSGSRPI